MPFGTFTERRRVIEANATIARGEYVYGRCLRTGATYEQMRLSRVAFRKGNLMGKAWADGRWYFCTSITPS